MLWICWPWIICWNTHNEKTVLQWAWWGERGEDITFPLTRVCIMTREYQSSPTLYTESADITQSFCLLRSIRPNNQLTLYPTLKIRGNKLVWLFSFLSWITNFVLKLLKKYYTFYCCLCEAVLKYFTSPLRIWLRLFPFGVLFVIHTRSWPPLAPVGAKKDFHINQD